MALLKCPDCGGKVSDLAPACPHCGRPANASARKRPPRLHEDVKAVVEPHRSQPVPHQTEEKRTRSQPRVPGQGLTRLQFIALSVIFIIVGIVALSLLNTDSAFAGRDEQTLSFFGVLAFLVSSAQRLANIGHSRLWSLVGLIPIIGLILFCYCLVAPEGYANTKRLDHPPADNLTTTATEPRRPPSAREAGL